MKNFVNVDTRFQKSINLTLDTGDMALVNRYIPTRSSVSILKQYLTNIVRGQGEHATILIGPYGKGKSHLLLVLLALLCKSKDETAEIQKKIIEADNSTKLLFMELAEVGRPFLPVIVSSFQGDLNESFIFALQEALKKTGIRDLPLPSEYSEAVRTMESWKEFYPDTYQRFEKMLEERGCTASLFKERLKKQKEATLLEFKEFYPVLTSGSVFNPMVQKEALRVYEEVNRVLCAKYGYAGIYIIFDEFSKYIEGHEAKNFAKDMKILQDMCELADSRKEEQMYLTFVAHKSIHEYVKSIDSEMIQAFRGVEGRLKEIRFVVSSQNNYELIEHALHKKEGFYTSEIQERAEASYQLACFSHLFEKEDFNQIVAKGCYPLTPVCAYALLNISEKIGQNERTVFTFLAGNEPGSLNRIMEGRNRENLIGVEYVYDYFKNLFRETVDETYIHNEWLKAEYALTKADTEIEKRIIKAMAIIRMIRRPEELAVLNKPICLALNIEKEECDKAMRELTGMEFNRYLSQICEDYYSLAPRINHELLNIQNVQGQYLKARNDVVRAILDGKDLEEYERGSSPQAMVYRAAFLRTGLAGEDFPLDGGCRKIMEEIEDFFVKASGKRVSFQMLYERLQGKDYGVRKGVLPLFLAWKFYLLEGMPVLYLGNKELLITVEVLNNINQFPESYDLYIEKKDMEKELYLQEMEDIFCDAQTEKIIRSNRLSVIMENMQKWYRSLPQYTRVSERYPQEMLYAVRNFRRLLKQTELNPREFLFEQLPNAMDSSKNHMTGLLVREMKRSMDTHFENAIEDTAKEIKKIFGAKESDSLKACLQDWYGRQQNRSKRYVLNKKIKSFMEYVGELNTNDEQEIVAVLSKRLEDIYIEDWNDRLQEKFLRDITKIRQKTEAAKEDAGLENGQKEIFLKTADGAEIHKYYDADVKDSTSEFLKNMIEEALDNFGDSLETNQKVAVLAEALEKLLQ